MSVCVYVVAFLILYFVVIDGLIVGTNLIRHITMDEAI